MAELFTPDFGFVKPQPGTGEPAAIEKINSNFDKVEKWGKVIWVNDGVTPPTADLIEGSIVAELTSGKVWIAKKNIGGTFDKKFIRYPYLGIWVSNPSMPNNTYAEWGLSTYNSGVNSSPADVVSNKFVVPVSGIWTFTNNIRWNGSGVGDRWMVFAYNGSPDYSSEVIHKPDATTGGASAQMTFTRNVPAGTTIVPFYKQTSGGTLVGTAVFSAMFVQAL